MLKKLAEILEKLMKTAQQMTLPVHNNLHLKSAAILSKILAQNLPWIMSETCSLPPIRAGLLPLMDVLGRLRRSTPCLPRRQLGPVLLPPLLPHVMLSPLLARVLQHRMQRVRLLVIRSQLMRLAILQLTLLWRIPMHSTMMTLQTMMTCMVFRQKQQLVLVLVLVLFLVLLPVRSLQHHALAYRKALNNPKYILMVLSDMLF
jgi:hypothetical protein